MFWGHGITIFSTIAPLSWFCFFVHIFLFTRNYFPAISFLWKCLSSSFMQLKFPSSLKFSLTPKVEAGVTFPMTFQSQRHYASLLLCLQSFPASGSGCHITEFSVLCISLKQYIWWYAILPCFSLVLFLFMDLESQSTALPCAVCCA